MRLNENALNEKDVQSIKLQQITDSVSMTEKELQLAFFEKMFETSAYGSNFEIYKSAINTHREKLIERCTNSCSVEKKNSENSSSKVEICMEQEVRGNIQVLSKSDIDPKQNSLLQKKERDVDKNLKNFNGSKYFISKNKDKTSLTVKAESVKGERNSDKNTDKSEVQQLFRLNIGKTTI